MSRLLLAAALATCAFAAQAVPEYGGHFGTNPSAMSVPHAFHDAQDVQLDLVYLFELQGGHDALALGFVVDPGDRFEAVGSMLSLWRSNGDLDFGNDQLIGGFDFGDQAVVQGFKGLASGEYFWRVESRVTGSDGVIVFGAGLDPVAAVPEPGTYALMAAGLLAVARIARRRASRMGPDARA